MNGVIFAPRYDQLTCPAHPEPRFRADAPNVPLPCSDATGAFHIGARKFASLHGLPDPVLFDNQNKPKGRKEILDAIGRAHGPLQVVAYFGHGMPLELRSAGFSPINLASLATAIRAQAASNLRIVLYACSVGAPGGFADQLAAALSGSNPKVYGHSTARHSFYNPDVTCSPPGGQLIPPGDPVRRLWEAELSRTGSTLWARFPFMSLEEIREELTTPTVSAPHYVGRGMSVARAD